MRAVVVGASSGLGRCIATGLGQSGAQVALLARRVDRLERAAAEAGERSVAIACDATDPDSCRRALDEAATALGGIDGLVYAAGVAPLGRIEEVDVATWRRAFDTNVLGASLTTAAALPHLRAASGTAVFLSSVSASQTPPWPGLAAYGVTKAALDKLVEAWRGEHPEVGFTRLVVGECGGGPGDATTEMATDWDPELAGEMFPTWLQRNYMTGALMDVSHLVAMVERILASDATVCMPTVTVAPRLVTPEVFPTREEIHEGAGD